jgi:replicative DNA helicase
LQETRLPPHDIDAEEAVNGSLLIDGAAIYEVASLIKAADFFSEQNRLIYTACLALSERAGAINQITVAEELERRQELAAAGGAAYLSHLISIVPTSLDIQHYARIVSRLSVMRNLIAAASQIAAIGYEGAADVSEALGKAESVIFRIRNDRNTLDFVHIKTILDKYLTDAGTQQEGTAPGEALTSILSGFSRLDEFMGGLQRSDLIIVAGRPSMGKTSFALTIAKNAALNQKAKIALFSLEMASQPVAIRMLSSEANIDYARIWRHQYEAGSQEEMKVMEATGKLSDAPIYIDDSPMLRIAEMRAKAHRLQMEHGLDLIILDYLQLMQSDIRTDNRVQEISYITRSLKAIARELNVPLIAVSQLSRAVEGRVTHKPQLSDLRESGSIEQDADIVMFIYRDDYYFKTEEEWLAEFPERDYPAGIATIMIAKHRNGPTGEIALHFVPQTARFEDMDSSIVSEQTLL